MQQINRIFGRTVALAAVIVLVNTLVVFAEGEDYIPALYSTFWALIPPVVAIALALITKEVYSSLFIGIVIGGAFWSGFSFEGTVNHVLKDGIIAVLSDSYNMGILVFLVILGVLVSLMNETGSSAAFSKWAQTHIKTRVGAQISVILLGVLIFIDDYFNCLTVGSVMRPVADKHNISRAKLAYLIDSTAAPICIIAPISSWAAAVTGFVPGEDGFQIFIRRVNVNIAATTVENYKKLEQAGIGTYILFQETYHKPTYETLHPNGPKHDYAYHTEAMDRAMEGDIDDVGIGVLFGLYKYRYDFIGLLMHAEHLEAKFGVGPHTISVPRIRPADDIDVNEFPEAIVDSLFRKIVALIRISTPYTGMIISTRESEESRRDVLDIGVSQISGGSSTSVGGYVKKELLEDNSAQFDTSDKRTLDEIIHWLLKLGYVPSFCTACYRAGRTGDRFMALAKSGQIGNVCQPNSLMTLKEYLLDYASPQTKLLGEQVIHNEMLHIKNPKVQEIAKGYIAQLEHGSRDFRF